MQKVTYCLRVNHTQYRYLENEIKKTHHMHAYFQKKIQKQPEINDSLLYKEMLSYQKKYMKMMHEQEVYAMWKQLKKQTMKEQQDTKAIYICRDVLQNFRWRGISLYPLLHVKYHWQRVPLLFHYEVVTSLLFIRKHTIYLVVGFQDKTEI